MNLNPASWKRSLLFASEKSFGSLSRRKLSLGNLRRNGAFTLVEITLAIGITSFSLLTAVGLLSVGLQTVQDSVIDAGTANIVQNLRTRLVATPMASVQSLAGKSEYYSQDGRVAKEKDAYFRADFEVGTLEAPDQSDTFATNTKLLKVTLKYPQLAAADSQLEKTVSLLTSGAPVQP